jgi:16S rRNA (cytosine967-C5)-methyltransferase
LSARDSALNVLIDIESRGRYAHLAVPAELAKSALDRRDRAFFTELVYGVLRQKLTLDWLIELFSARRIEKIEPRLKILLELGLYQLLYLDRVPDHAAVDSTVETAKKKFHAGAGKFANAILRRAARERDNLPWPAREGDLARFLSVYYSHPAWLVELWLEELGAEATESLLAADNLRPKVSLRTNFERLTRDELAAIVSSQGLQVSRGEVCPEALVLEGESPPEEVLSAGLAYVQDQASMAVGRAVSPRPGETVIDLCAAPGGKATHLAELMTGRGRVFAVDINQGRLRLVAENARRLGADIVTTLAGDAAQPLNLPEADSVLLDAPCSGLGVLRRRPDLRWRKTPEDITALAELQLSILKQAANYVRPGGWLTYSVCTITRAETYGTVAAFKAARADFEQFTVGGQGAPSGAAAVHWADRAAPEDPMSVQFRPDRDDTDGMFIAQFRKAP